MEAKKEDKKHEGIKSTRNFEDDIFQISQKLITSLKNEENHARIIEDLTKNDFPQLTKKYNEEKQKIDELTDTLKRLQAEFENYKKWNSKEKTEFVKYAHADVISQLLPVLDSFEIALKNTSDKEKFVEGIKIIYAQFHSILEAEGLKPIKATGEKFDPYRHEVLMKEESDKPEETILEEFQKGYMLNDKVLRHSKVKVSGK
ncbi:nucleotide exchange factor GrpE [Candidatus Woesearchaeota archaeon]|nr:nucleotide exchange factor GrpE [Candidatus Woesearchaeota archaeon]